MRAKVFGAAVAASAIAAVVVARRRSGASSGAGTPSAPRSGWLSVTVYRDAGDVMPGGRVPPPLTGFGDSLEVEVRPAPGDKGTELRARFRPDGQSGAHGGAHDGRGRLRAALREAKQRIEVGEVLWVDPVPHGRRTATPTGLLVDLASARSNEGGTL